MCGIAGIVPLIELGYELKGHLLKMSQIIKHRGPDDEGYIFCNDFVNVSAGGEGTPSNVWDSPYKPQKRISEVNDKFNIYLAHRRLSIIDLSPAGHQPMEYHNEELWIVFNGEIYNYIELRNQLKNKGYTFRTQTDTEVILAAYKEWGEELLSYLNGMWAFVIYDKKSNKIFGARDRFGVKPLYYFLNDHFFAFASEQKALVSLDFVNSHINPNAVFDYFIKGKIELQDESFFSNVKEIHPGFSFNLNLKNKKFKLNKYYTLETHRDWESLDEKKLSTYTSEIKELIFNAVNLRLRSDTVVGSCLSGGIDSSSLVAIISDINKQKFTNRALNAFTASFPNESIDESKWANIVIDNTQTKWHQTFPDSPGLLENLENLIYHQDIPFLGCTTYSQYCVMQLINQTGIKVTIDGQGADELFAGYLPHLISFSLEALKNKDFAMLKENFCYNTLGNSKELLRALIKSTLSGNPASKFLKKEFKYLNKDIWKYNCSSKESLPTSLNEHLRDQFQGSDLKLLLRTADRNSMRFSVESRVPFADDINLIEYVFNIPSSYKIKNGLSKYLLRSSMRGVTPTPILERRDKLGFASPQAKWLYEQKNNLKTYITDDLNDFCDSKGLLKDWDLIFEDLKKTGNNYIWRFINFAIWKKTFRK